MTLFADGKKLGEISAWKLIERLPETKTVLGKHILTQKPKDQCEFISPKPVNRKSQLWLISDKKIKWTLTEVKVKDGTFITATVADRQ
jgi:hypothetical protein